MNSQHSDSDGLRTRRQVILAALLVALLGLTIAPGAKCTHESNADGSTRTIVES